MSFQIRKRVMEEGFQMTPLVDVMFNLLIFVIITAQYSHLQSLKVNLPKAVTGASLEKEESVVITITREEAVFLNNQPVPIETLKERLGALARREETPRVILQADEGSKTGQLVRVMDLASQAGLKKISIETRKEGRE